MPKTTENVKPAKSHLLFDKIVPGQNIYNAIYCMESYVFEKGLLDSNIPVKSIDGEILANNDLDYEQNEQKYPRHSTEPYLYPFGLRHLYLLNP